MKSKVMLPVPDVEVIMNNEDEKVAKDLILREGDNMKGHNRGSATIEVTLIMPILLMLMTLFITMLLGVFQQAEVHSRLMYDSAVGEEEKYQQNDSVHILFQKDKIIYSQGVKVSFVRGYEVSSKEQQVSRSSNVEDNLRRWQVLGDFGSE